jgi:hypothetical protein
VKGRGEGKRGGGELNDVNHTHDTNPASPYPHSHTLTIYTHYIHTLYTLSTHTLVHRRREYSSTRQRSYYHDGAVNLICSPPRFNNPYSSCLALSPSHRYVS